MKVKIAYTVDLDDIPAETVKLLSGIGEKIEDLQGILASCKEQCSNEDILNAIKSLEKMNNFMYECSLVTGDAHAILSDFVVAKIPRSDEGTSDAAEEG